MKIEKYEACGNDFLIIESSDINYSFWSKKWCNRHFSFGADGLIVIDIENKTILFFNGDGSEAEVCGNGLRCAYKYILKNYSMLNIDYLKAKDGIHYFENNENIKVSFPLKLPIEINQNIWMIQGKHYPVFYLNVGNPHAVIIHRLQKNEIESFENYVNEKKVNINFVEIISFQEIKVQTIERGVGLTLSCGSGVLASVIALHQKNQIGKKVLVNTLGGQLCVDLNNDVVLQGEANFVYQSEVYANE